MCTQTDFFQYTQKLVELECLKWTEKGVNVKYETRKNRNGYKAGALKEGLEKQYVKDCQFVVIFDADFQPDEDFLRRTIPYLLENKELGLVQARWKFGKTTKQDRFLCEPKLPRELISLELDADATYPTSNS